jgi:outer membrane immunogenic protein
MGNDSVTFPVSAIAVTRSNNIRQDLDMGAVRLNYRFGGGPTVASY